MPRTPHYLTLSQAAKETGKSKSVISKALKNGKISAVEKDESGYKIDPAELFRVFPPKSDAANENDEKERSRTPKASSEHATENSENTGEISVLKAENKLLHERIKDKEERITELKDERERLFTEKDHWRHQAERLLLTYQHDQSAADAGEGSSRGWQQRMLMTVLIVLGMVGVLALIYFQDSIKATIDQDVVGNAGNQKPQPASMNQAPEVKPAVRVETPASTGVNATKNSQ